jgi:hypothetical protein
VLQNVGHSGCIWRIRLEADGEDIVCVVAGDVQIFGASLVVLKVERRQLQLRYLLDALESEAMELLARLRKIGDICYRRICSTSDVSWSQYICLCTSGIPQLTPGGSQHY